MVYYIYFFNSLGYNKVVHPFGLSIGLRISVLLDMKEQEQQKRDHLACSTSQQILKAYAKLNPINQQLFKLKDLTGVELILTKCSVVCQDLLDLELSLVINTSSPSAFRIV